MIICLVILIHKVLIIPYYISIRIIIEKVFFRFWKVVIKKYKDHDIIGTIISITSKKELTKRLNFVRD